MTISLIEDIIKWLNLFPSKGGASPTIGPSPIAEGKGKPDMSYDRPDFESYCLAFTQSSNRQKARSVPSIALRESNERSGPYFMKLYTGERTHSQKWNILPIDDDVIQQVESISAEQGQPEMTVG